MRIKINEYRMSNIIISQCCNLAFNWKSETYTLPKLAYLLRVRPSAQPKEAKLGISVN